MVNKVIVNFTNGKSVKVNKWKVEVGQTVYHGRALLLYEEDDKGKLAKLKSKCVGTIINLIAKEGEILNPGDPMFEVEEGCSHPTVINDLCAECGADLQREGVSESNATVPMVHHIPQLKVSQQEAQILGKADTERLLKDRKLVLLVDLDQTLIHTTHDNIPNNIKDVHHFQLGTAAWYHTRLRPNTAHFLKEMSQYFELHICTFGVRPYAHMVASILDRDQALFSNRILSRDECFNFNSKVANLQALFPNGDELVCIIDDRKDVWNNSPNLIPVKPYTFFTNTGDINDPNLPPAVKHSDFFAKGVKVMKGDKEEGSDSKMEESDVLDVQDEDDYLLYLESILKKVHQLFYDVYDKKTEGQAEVRWVLEQLRGSVLKGCEIVFSGLVPLHAGLENSEPYLMATDLGAKIGKAVTETTTHIVAARVGTAKLHESKKFPNIKIVNPHWLTTCIYRWEQVDERLFPLISPKDDKSTDKVNIALSLDDVLSMQQEVQAEFNSDSSNNDDSDNPKEQESDASVKETITVQNNVENDLTTVSKNPAKSILVKSSLKSIIREIAQSSTENSNTTQQNVPLISQTILKISKAKPVQLDFLKNDKVVTEFIKHTRIPKKRVRIEEKPQIKIIKDGCDPVTAVNALASNDGVTQLSKKKKRKMSPTKPSTSTAVPVPAVQQTGSPNNLLKKHQQGRNKRKLSLKLLEDEYNTVLNFNREEYRRKFEHNNKEHLALVKKINEEYELSLKHLTEKHGLSLSHLHEIQSIKINHMTEEHSKAMNHLDEYYRSRMELLMEIHPGNESNDEVA